VREVHRCGQPMLLQGLVLVGVVLHVVASQTRSTCLSIQNLGQCVESRSLPRYCRARLQTYTAGSPFSLLSTLGFSERWRLQWAGSGQGWLVGEHTCIDTRLTTKTAGMHTNAMAYLSAPLPSCCWPPSRPLPSKLANALGAGAQKSCTPPALGHFPLPKHRRVEGCPCLVFPDHAVREVT
jgi:hypothetical protein